MPSSNASDGSTLVGTYHSGETETSAYPVEVIGKCSDDCSVIRLERAQNAIR